MTDPELLHAFHSCTLPAAEWTHEAHLRVAYLYARQYPLDEAHLLFRIHLIRLNASHAVPESKDRGYHDTLTRMWIALIAAAIAKGDSAGDSRAFLARHPEFENRKIGLNYYSRDRINSTAARARYLEPDLAPLPA